jgi:hypothetical protein
VKPRLDAEATLPELTRTQHSQSYGVFSSNAKSKCAAPLIPARSGRLAICPPLPRFAFRARVAGCRFGRVCPDFFQLPPTSAVYRPSTACLGYFIWFPSFSCALSPSPFSTPTASVTLASPSFYGSHAWFAAVARVLPALARLTLRQFRADRSCWRHGQLGLAGSSPTLVGE